MGISNKTVGRWWKLKRNSEGLTLMDVATKLDKPFGTVASWENRGVSYFTAIMYGKKMGWEVPKAEEISAIAGPDEEPKGNKDGDVATLTISSITPSAGVGVSNEHEILTQVIVTKEWLHNQYPNIKNIHALALCQPRGDSMYPTFKKDDTLIVDRTVTSFETEGVYVFSYDGEVFLKRVQRIPARGVKVISDNREVYDAYELAKAELENVQVLGLVIGKWRYSHV